MCSSHLKRILWAALALVGPGILSEAAPSKPLSLSEVLQAAAKIDQLLEADLRLSLIHI